MPRKRRVPIAALLFCITLRGPFCPAQEAAVGPPDPDTIRQLLGDGPDAETLRQVGPAITSLLADDDTAFDALPLADLALERLLPAGEADENWPLLEILLKQSARVCFQEADPTRAARHLNLLESLYRKQAAIEPEDTAARFLSRRLASVASSFLHGERLPEALPLLAEIADLDAAFHDDEFDGSVPSAVTALHRALRELNAVERYRILHDWTLASGAGRSVRVLHELTPGNVPSPVFARVLGQRPRDDAFSVPNVGPAAGLFSSAWLLVSSAAESGRLTQLIAELTKLAQQDVPHAGSTLLLSRILAAESDIAELERDLAAHPGERVRPVDVVIAAACLSQPHLHAVADDILKRLISTVTRNHSPRLAPVVHRLHALSVVNQSPDSSDSLLRDPNLSLWLPASAGDAHRDGGGAVNETWLASEEHILHLCGPHRDYLCFRYPLTGDFDFYCEAQDGQAPQGAVAYGGLATEAFGAGGYSKIWNVDTADHLQRPFPFVRTANWKTFQRWHVSVSGPQVEFVCNGHPVWTGRLAGTSSPWLAIRSFGPRIPAFRNLRLTGSPKIPRQVRMSDGDTLAGWFATYYPSSISPRIDIADQPATDNATTELDWTIQDGVVHGRHTPDALEGVVPSRLSYLRPLQTGETIRYDFLWKPGESVVHPAIDRTAFVFDPSGVRVRWLTTGPDDATGLPVRNSVFEPQHRRGPRRLPLKHGEWNSVELIRHPESVQLSLNGTLIYEHPLDALDTGQFSLTYDRKRSDAQIRNVVLSGDWPERLNLNVPLLATRDERRSAMDSATIGRIFNDRHVPDSALDFHRRANALTLPERFDFLSRWVLPGRDHDTFRLALDLTPTHPAPPVRITHPIDDERLAAGKGRHRIPSGGNLISPAIDLIEAASKLGRLAELKARVRSTTPRGEVQQRCQIAMLILIDLATDRIEAAVEGLNELHSRLEAQLFDDLSDRWPETLAVYAATRHPQIRDAAQDMLTRMLNYQVRGGHSNGPATWDRLVEQLHGQGLHKVMRGSSGEPIQSLAAQPALKNWSAVGRSIAWSRGQGMPVGHWHATPGQIQQLASHDDDFLYYRIPLRGDFEVECDVHGFGWHDTALLVVGEWVGPVYDHTSYETGGFRRKAMTYSITPRLTESAEWIHYRVVIRDGKCTTFFNGRRIHERELPENHDPWLAVRSLAYRSGGVRDVRITGNPVVPKTISLSSLRDLPGWLPYYSAPLIGPDERWQLVQVGSGSRAGIDTQARPVAGNVIVGRREPELAGQAAERLLRYHRPMLEDGVINYEFFYQPGMTLAHPALDRKVFMLTPDGVQIHWATDADHERSNLDARNLTVEQGTQLVAGLLPLQPDQWNMLRLTLQGSTVSLSLNGQPVYRGEIEVTNQRTFSLFHYADRHDARIRNVNWAGTWPRQIRSVEQQEMMRPTVESLVAQLKPLKARFEHDFAQDGLPTELFNVYDDDRTSQVTLKPDGVHVDRPRKQGYVQTVIATKMWIHGDFDLEATFSGLQLSPSENGAGGIGLRAVLEDPLRTHCCVLRGRSRFAGATERQYVESQYILLEKDGPNMQFPGNTAEASQDGRLRLIRHGTSVSTYFAEGNSPHFRHVHTQTDLPQDRSLFDGVQLLSNVHASTPGDAYVRVVWKSLTVRAEKIIGQP